jgi:hypothetical protein
MIYMKLYQIILSIFIMLNPQDSCEAFQIIPVNGYSIFNSLITFVNNRKN